MQAIIATLLKVIISKKLLLILLQKIAESTDNKLDDSGVQIMEGLLYNDLGKVETGIIKLVDTVVPSVANELKKR